MSGSRSQSQSPTTWMWWQTSAGQLFKAVKPERAESILSVSAVKMRVLVFDRLRRIGHSRICDLQPPPHSPTHPWTPHPRICASNPRAWRAYSGPGESAGALATDWSVYSTRYIVVDKHLLFIVSDLHISTPHPMSPNSGSLHESHTHM